MSNPTSNFGWQMPTNSDLVTDLPADFEVFGQAVDTSLADLKGGTTGQVLSKTSNTDMDFTWVTTDDANAIQNSIVDAKGDLITATAADTPARLAVGANNTVLVADSAEATGLKWGGAWTTWSPTIGGFNVGNGTAVYRYAQIGKTVFVDFHIVWGSTTSISAPPNWSLPVEPKYVGWSAPANFIDSGVGYYFGRAITNYTTYSYFSFNAINTSSTYAQGTSLSATVPFTFGTGDGIDVQFCYEAA